MRTRLDGARAKIERAKYNVAQLKAELHSGLMDNRYGVIRQEDSDTGEVVDELRMPYEDRLRFSIVAGDIYHALRSALDHLAWQLVRANGKTPGRHTAFPIFKSDDADSRAKRQKAMRGIAKYPIAIIENLQPYKAGNAYTSHPLWLLHELSIEDKHRVPVVSVFAIQHRTGGPVGTGPVMIIDKLTVSLRGIEPLDDRAEILRFMRGPVHREVDVQEQYTFQVTFEKSGPGQGEPFIPTLQKLIDFVEGVIQQFMPYL